MAAQEKGKLSRRQFIAGAAVLGASGTMVACSPQSKKLSETGASGDGEGGPFVPDEIYAGVCRGNCDCGCSLNIHVRNGRVVRTSARELPDPRYNRICSKGLTHPARMYSSNRLQYPMKRVGERGEGKFERISWDEALDEIAEKWNGYIAEYGPQSIAVWHGSGNYGVCSGIPDFCGFIFRFEHALGCTSIPLNVDFAVGYSQGKALGGAGNEPTDFENSKTFVCWGGNPANSQIQTMHFILEAKDKGTKYVVVDPCYNMNTAKADLFVPIKPATDTALAFGVMNVLFERGWLDDEYVRDHTNAPYLVKEDGEFLKMSDMGVEPATKVDELTGEEVLVDPYVVLDEGSQQIVDCDSAASPAVTGVFEANGIKVRTVLDILKETASEWDAARVERVSGVPKEMQEELARIYHEDGPVHTYNSFGMNHYYNGHQLMWSVFAIPMLTGNVGKPGAGVRMCMFNPATTFNMASMMPEVNGEAAPGIYKTITVNKLNDVLDTGMYNGEPLPIKSIYIACANVMTTMTDHNYNEEWARKVEFLVVADNAMTETASYADILLPTAHWFEQEELFQFATTSPYCLYQDKAVDPLYESKPDFEIWQLLGERLGIGDSLAMSTEDYIREVLDNDNARGLGITYEALKEKKAIRAVPEGDFIGNPGGAHATRFGRGVLYDDVVTPQYNDGQEIDVDFERKINWLPSLEAAEDSEARKKHPFQLMNERMRVRTHSQWWDVGYLTELYPEPLVRINPGDAQQLGVQEGDNVRLFNDRGEVVAKSTIASNTPQGIVTISRSHNANEFISGHTASLSTNTYHPLTSNQIFNDVAVSVEKA